MTIKKIKIMKKISFNERYGLQQAVLDGTKTMTRRIIPDIKIEWNSRGEVTLPIGGFENDVLFMDVRKILPDMGSSDYSAPTKYQPRYERGEEVAVAQRYKDCWNSYQQLWEAKNDPSDWHTPDAILGDQVKETPGWKNKMFVRADLMPHRIRITDIRVERLRDISNKDCMKEGIRQSVVEYGDKKIVQWTYFAEKRTIWFDSPSAAFSVLIDRISGRGTWERNPWVFVYEFELIK